MARKPFVIIDAEILSSSVWSEAPHVRLVWLTMLILCDTEGYVGAAVPGIARAAGVTVAETRDALERLKAPDPDSRTKTDEGRRVREVERGFQVLNFKEHLARLSRERAMSRERVRRFREKRKLAKLAAVHVTAGNVTVTAGKREQGIGNREQEHRVVSASVEGGSPEGGNRIELRRVLVETNPRQHGEKIEDYRARIDALMPRRV